MSDNFLDYYDLDFSDETIGLKVEREILKHFIDDVASTGIHVSSELQWISSTPDGWHHLHQIPIEIKTTLKPMPPDKIIRKYYHQIQFEMFCSQKKRLLLIHAMCHDVQYFLVHFDEQFVTACISRLKIAFIEHFFREKVYRVRKGDYEKAMDSIVSLREIPKPEPTSSIIKKNLCFELLNWRHAFPNATQTTYSNFLRSMSSLWSKATAKKPIFRSTVITHIARNTIG